MKFLLAIAICLSPLLAGDWDTAYDTALRQLDQAKYDLALQNFDKVRETARLDAALYWKAYSLNKLGRTQEALSTLQQLKQAYPKSRWLSDAQVLEADVQQGNGKASPEDANNDELKMMALNGLLNADPERAFVQIDRILKGSYPPKLKEKALFVLSTSTLPKAQKLLLDTANGKGNPELQAKAIRYVGMSGTAESKKRLLEMYHASTDKEAKKEVIRSLMIAAAPEQVLEIAKAEKDISLRDEAIRTLGLLHKVPVSLYLQAPDPSWKKPVIYALFLANDAKGLIELARHETDGGMKKMIVNQLSIMQYNKDAAEYMLEILK